LAKISLSILGIEEGKPAGNPKLALESAGWGMLLLFFLRRAMGLPAP